ncbi:RlpA-like double-psi beta-barrel-protein domain-containing protein-containing protein, partial [Dimargaris cristalligena]
SGGGSEEFTGDGTFYSPSVGTGSCGTDHSDSEKVAALNAPQFGNPANPNASPFCGRKVRVTGPKGTTEATIVDKCPVCKSGDLDLSPGAFDEIGDEDAGRIPITWSF